MGSAVDLVGRHLRAVWASDWAELHRTLSLEAKLEISRGEWTHSEWEVGNFYRHITQAWDFAPGDVYFSDDADGSVRVKMRLTNGGAWIKEVDGEYRVRGGRIEHIRIADSPPFTLPDAPSEPPLFPGR